MKENKEYIITDTEEFVHLMRSTAASSLAEEYLGKTKQYSDKDLDGITTLNQVESIIAEKSIDVDEESKYIINGDIFEDIFDEVRNLIYQSAMSQLAAKGYIECAWDDEKNKMVFWVDKEKDDTYNK
jgi:hypothetical protein